MGVLWGRAHYRWCDDDDSIDCWTELFEVTIQEKTYLLVDAARDGVRGVPHRPRPRPRLGRNGLELDWLQFVRDRFHHLYRRRHLPLV